MMPNRNFSAEPGYRYGFNGHEKSDEIKGEGNSYTADYWEFDPRLGKRWNTDPIDRIWESPYAVFINNPILFSDPDGADAEDRAKRKADKHLQKLREQGYTNATYTLSNNADGNIQVSFQANMDNNVVVIAGFVENRSWMGRQLNKAKQFTVTEVWPRVLGGLKTSAGMGLIFAGGLLAEVGIGVPILLYGADLAQSGARQVWDGRHHKTLFVEGLEALGLSSSEANNVDLAVGTWASAESGTVLTAPKNVDPSLRMQYEEEVRNLKTVVERMKNDGVTSELIARTVQGMRRALGVKYKDMTPKDVLETITQRNLKKYGDPLGPTIEYLRKQGKSWDYIIKSACTPGGKDLKL
jgi:hypothetical protein